MEPERMLADVELLCRVEDGRDVVVADMGGGSTAVATLVHAMSSLTAEHAAGAVVAVVGSSEALQVEATQADAMAQLSLDGAERLLRARQALLKMLDRLWRDAAAAGGGATEGERSAAADATARLVARTLACQQHGEQRRVEFAGTDSPMLSSVRRLLRREELLCRRGEQLVAAVSPVPSSVLQLPCA